MDGASPKWNQTHDEKNDPKLLRSEYVEYFHVDEGFMMFLIGTPILLGAVNNLVMEAVVWQILFDDAMFHPYHIFDISSSSLTVKFTVISSS